MAAGFTFTLDAEILADAEEAERLEQGARDKAAAENARILDQEKARLKAELVGRQTKIRAEAEARAALEAERLAKEEAAIEAQERAEAVRLSKEQAAVNVRLAKKLAEEEAKRNAAEEMLKIEELKRQELAAKLAKQAKPKEPKKPTLTHPCTGTVTTAPAQVTLAPGKSSPWGGKAFLPPANKQPTAVTKSISSDVFKVAAPPPPPFETPAESAKPMPKKTGVLGAAFTKRQDGSA